MFEIQGDIYEIIVGKIFWDEHGNIHYDLKNLTNNIIITNNESWKKPIIKFNNYNSFSVLMEDRENEKLYLEEKYNKNFINLELSLEKLIKDLNYLKDFLNISQQNKLTEDILNYIRRESK